MQQVHANLTSLNLSVDNLSKELERQVNHVVNITREQERVASNHTSALRMYMSESLAGLQSSTYFNITDLHKQTYANVSTLESDVRRNITALAHVLVENVTVAREEGRRHTAEVNSSLTTLKTDATRNHTSLVQQHDVLGALVEANNRSAAQQFAAVHTVTDTLSANVSALQGRLSDVNSTVWNAMRAVNDSLVNGLSLLSQGVDEHVRDLNHRANISDHHISALQSTSAQLLLFKDQATAAQSVLVSRVTELENVTVTSHRDIVALQCLTSHHDTYLIRLDHALNRTEREQTSLLQTTIPALDKNMSLLWAQYAHRSALDDLIHNGTRAQLEVLAGDSKELRNGHLDLKSRFESEMHIIGSFRNDSVSRVNHQEQAFNAFSKEVAGELGRLNVSLMVASASIQNTWAEVKGLQTTVSEATEKFSVSDQMLGANLSLLTKRMDTESGDLRERVERTEKQLRELTERMLALEASNRAKDKRIEQLESDISRHRHEHASQSDLDNVKKLLNEMQSTMVAHSGQVLDLVTAVYRHTMAPSGNKEPPPLARTPA
eukprot:gene2894-3539_t